MSLRRFAQENNAGSPKSPLANPPSTPRSRASIGIYRSPASTASISSSIPFDWEAARSHRPPPYATPMSKARKSLATPGGSGTPRRKAVVRKRSLYERITSIPSNIAFQIALFPHNLPLPSSKTSARIIGSAMHFLHLCTRISQINKVPDSDVGWEDMYHEGEGTPWFDWTLPMTLLLIFSSIFNTAYLFSRTRIYRFHKSTAPLSSPNARTVAAELDFEPLKPPSLMAQLRSGLWYAFSYSWRWLLGMSPPSMSKPLPPKTSKVQQLSAWNPGELELELFSIYSPIHALLWLATSSANWILLLFIMGLTSVQLNIIIHSYNIRIRDKELIAAEVMNEYNEEFVYPRVNPIRRDAAVMTHQSEVVNVWED
ncbi:hypothetical protein AGABI1DRAFT_118118 [Agaricus bisporus var. burnettii JB137-S8]|uniref:Nuclear rim protein 1 n=2 Tax=Agaricus bisporus var. burnettii TaxID=192524 RepID=K5Y3W9_AGABU|nr:uncharacterized protein AGABI1DRAFT_118118 [Agaricus bisporus var. burnettii JB137-S8]EKM82675.1 hypothetical protein AGABI1DRAFT_118118 [Agaricus bisporus var. burnettii JB137-S8]KAF7778716.1 hypothetical protein Agabi119p4_3061 [Agaricus bisporus var. burnettii]